MSYQIPKFRHPGLPVNELGYTKAAYEGSISTLCAGCGHDSISGAIVRACHELSLEPHKIAKLSGIGCSSQDTHLFSQQIPRLQLGARAYALGGDGRGDGEPRPVVPGRFR